MKKILLVISVTCCLLISNQGCRRHPEYTAFTHCNIIDGTGSQMKPDQTIILKEDIIYDLGSRVDIPKKCKVIDVSGKTFIPGLIDMHGHLFAAGASQLSSYPVLYLAGGVTTIFSPGEFEPDKVIQVRDRINNNESPGPKILTAGSYFETYPSAIFWMEGCKDTNEVVKKFKEWNDKIDAVKVYVNISEEQFRVIKRLAEESGFIITGHLGSLELRTAIDLGINGFEHGLFAIPELGSEKDIIRHLKEVAELDLGDENVQSLIKLIVQKNVYCDPTTVTFESILPGSSIADDIEKYLDPRALSISMYSIIRDSASARYVKEAIKKQLAFCKLIYDKGGILVTGTDPVNPKVLPGYGIEREMELFHEAGIPPVEVIKIATLNGASSLRISDKTGTIEKGKIADLVLLNGNPAEDFKSIRDVEIVIKSGRTFDPEELKKSIEHSVIAGKYSK